MASSSSSSPPQNASDSTSDNAASSTTSSSSPDTKNPTKNALKSSVASVDPASHPPPVNLANWISSRRDRLSPPVGNALLYGEGTEFKTMIVGGPNNRTDYHVEEGEEWFFMIKGDMVLKVVDGGVFKDVVIQEGHCFLLPPKVPHSPQRQADTIGLVIERERRADELDHLRWYCAECREVVYDAAFHCVDLGTQLKPVIEEYYASEELRTCKACGTVDLPPSAAGAKTVEVGAQVADYADKEHPAINPATHPPPLNRDEWIASHSHLLQPPVGNALLYGEGTEFKTMIVGGPNKRTDYHVEEGEEWFFMIKGDMVLKIVDGGEFKDVVIKEGESFLLPAKVPHSPQRQADTIGLVIERERLPDELDHLRWYCSACKEIVYDASFHCVDLGTQLKPVIEEYYASEELRTCKSCGTVDAPPA